MGYVKLKNGNEITVNKLNEFIPFVLLRNTILHIKVCKFIVETFYSGINDIEKTIMINFIAQRSKKIEQISAIILLSQKEDIVEINLDFFGEDLAQFIDYEVVFVNKTSKLYNVLNDKQLKSSIIKYFPNKLFRLLGRLRYRNQKFNSVVRAWVDIDEVLHKEHFSCSDIFIYPFGINVFRSFRFVKHCYKMYSGARLVGVPYSFFQMLKLLCSSPKNRDLLILRYEIDGMKRHAKDFEEYNKIYTSDEFLPAVYALYEEIGDGVKVVNNAHGIGCYNPIVNYTDFLLFNNAQKKYYEYFNDKIHFEIKQDNLIRNNKFCKKEEYVYVYVDQGDFKEMGYYYEHILQQRAITEIASASRQSDRRCYIKFHPNRKNNSRKMLFEKYPEYKEVEDFNKLERYNIIFINLYSTAYFDFQKHGNFIFVRENFFDPTVLFGDDINVVEVSVLGNKLISY